METRRRPDGHPKMIRPPSEVDPMETRRRSDGHPETTRSAPEVDPMETRRRSDGHPEERVLLGEMHIRRGRYFGVAPVPGGLTNVCLVRPSRPADPELADAAALLTRELARHPLP